MFSFSHLEIFANLELGEQDLTIDRRALLN